MLERAGHIPTSFYEYEMLYMGYCALKYTHDNAQISIIPTSSRVDIVQTVEVRRAS
jgi:hypothetical protein